MRKYLAVSALAALFLTNLAFADEYTGDELSSRPCGTIAKACVAAGYQRNAGQGRMFWKDCMKPVLLGKTVSGVSISAGDASACKQIKIQDMQAELQEFQQSRS